LGNEYKITIFDVNYLWACAIGQLLHVVGHDQINSRLKSQTFL
jgi:hypothetical protein